MIVAQTLRKNKDELMTSTIEIRIVYSMSAIRTRIVVCDRSDGSSSMEEWITSCGNKA